MKIPAPKLYEVALARKIQSYSSSSLVPTFRRMDVDNDGYISKLDLKNALHNMWGIDLTDSQIDDIFYRTASFGEGHRDSLSPTKYYRISYREFVKYIQNTAESTNFSSSQVYGANLHNGKPPEPPSTKMYSDTPQSCAARAKELRKAIFNLMTQHAPSNSAGGMAETHLFLQMDIRRNNHISPDEFRAWTHKLGLTLSREDVKMVWGKYWNEKGMDLNTFGYFMENLDATEESSQDCQQREMQVADNSSPSVSSVLKRPQSPSTKARNLRQTVFYLINEHVPTEMPETYLFLHMDANRNNRVAPEEFRSWANKMGLDLSIEEVKMIWGKHWKDDGINFKEFSDFVDHLNTTEGKSLETHPLFEEEDSKNKTTEQPPLHEDIRSALLADLKPNDGSDDKKSDYTLLYEFASHFYSKKHTLVEAFHILDFDGKDKIDQKKVSLGMRIAGLNITVDRANRLIEDFVGKDRLLDKADFVRMISSTLNTFDTDGKEIHCQSSTDILTHTRSPDRQQKEDILIIKKLRLALDVEHMVTRNLFECIDKDQSKDLSPDELMNVFAEHKIETSLDQVNRIMKRFAGLNGKTDRMQYYQFIKMLTADL